MSKNMIKPDRKKIKYGQVALHAFFILFSLAYILPFIMIISISISSTYAIQTQGFTLFPKEIDFTAYKIIFEDMSKLLQAYKVTISFTLTFVVLSITVQALLAYPMSKDFFPAKKALTWYVFITMLFNAGMIPCYIIYTKYYGLADSWWAYVLPGLVYAWNVIIIRTSYKNVPTEMLDAARIDGAGVYRTFTTMVVPLSKPVYATIGFLSMVGKWNDWNTTLIYIRDTKLYSLQYLMQNLLRSVSELEKLALSFSGYEEMMQAAPTDQMQFAMALLAAGPMLVIFPYFQKYFNKGLLVGSVKG